MNAKEIEMLRKLAITERFPMNRLIVSLLLVLVSFNPSIADEDTTLVFDSSDFNASPVFNSLNTFVFFLDFNDPDFAPGEIYVNPPLVEVSYFVSGSLPQPTPSGFPSFGLSRGISGTEFYDQGSSIEFEIRGDAIVDDGIQISDLVNGIVINAREVDTGRYHPPLIELFADGTGRIQNSNNMGGVNPVTGMVVDVDFGEEYIVDLTFDPAALTIFDGFPLGDLNRDCSVNLLDIAPFVDALLDPAYDFLADVNQDGSDDLLDIPALIKFFPGG